MANNFIQFSEVINNLTKEEEAWLTGVLDEEVDEEGEKCGQARTEFIKQFEGTPDAIDDAEFFPRFEWSVETEGEYAGDAAGQRYLWFKCEDSGEPSDVGIVVREFFKKFRPKDHFSLTYCLFCDKLRVGEFTGGGMFVTANSIKHWDADSWIHEQLQEFKAK